MKKSMFTIAILFSILNASDSDLVDMSEEEMQGSLKSFKAIMDRSCSGHFDYYELGMQVNNILKYKECKKYNFKDLIDEKIRIIDNRSVEDDAKSCKDTLDDFVGRVNSERVRMTPKSKEELIKRMNAIYEEYKNQGFSKKEREDYLKRYEEAKGICAKNKICVEDKCIKEMLEKERKIREEMMKDKTLIF